MVAKKKFFLMDCHLAGRKYHDADEVWDELKVGTTLRLERDTDNHYDSTAVAVIYERKNQKGTVEDEFLIGYIPRDYNALIANFLDMGWSEIFECRISKINPDVRPEEQVHLTIKLRRKE